MDHLISAMNLIAEDLQLVMGDELLGMDILNNDPWALAQSVGITILSDKELFASYVDMDFEGGVVVAAAFTSMDRRTFSFDVVVHRKYQNRGLGTKLIDMCMDEYKWLHTEDTDVTLAVDVVNERLVHFLEREYGLKVQMEEEGHFIMAQRTVTVKTFMPDTELPTVELVQRIKSYGQERQASYGLFVKARGLNPEISAKEFYEIWDSVSPNAHEKTEIIDFVPTHKYKDPKMEGHEIMVTQTTPYQVKYVTDYGGTGGHPIDMFDDFFEKLGHLKSAINLMAQRGRWKTLARHRWVANAVITESIYHDPTEDINDIPIRRYTATIYGFRNFKIYEGEPGLANEIRDYVTAVRDKIQQYGEDILDVISTHIPNSYAKSKNKLTEKTKLVELITPDNAERDVH